MSSRVLAISVVLAEDVGRYASTTAVSGNHSEAVDRIARSAERAMFSPLMTVISRRLSIASALAWAAMLLLLLAVTPDQELSTVLRLSGVVILGFTGALAAARGWHLLTYLVFVTSFFPVGWHFLGSPRYGIAVGVTMIIFVLSAVVNHIQHDTP